MNFNGIVVIVLVTLSAILIGVSAKIIAKRETEGQLDIQSEYLPLEKRPFCNAFTGCGKRSSGYDNRGQNNPFMKMNRKMINEAKMLQLLQNRYNNNEMPISGIDYISSRKRRSIQSDNENN